KFEKSNVPINPKQPKLFVSPGEDPANRDGRQNHPQNAGPQDRREKDVFLSSKPSAELVLLVVCAVLFCVLFTGLIRWGIKRRGRDKHGLTLTDHQRRMMQCVPLHARKPPDWTMATIYECEETPEVSPSPPSTQRTSCVVDIGTSRPDVPHQDLPPRPSGFPDTSSTEGLSLLSDRATSQSGTAQDTLLEDLEGSGSSSEDDMWSADECAGRYIPEISSPHSTSVASTTRESNNISTDRNPCGAGCRVVHEDQVLLLPPSHSQQLEATTAPGADSNNNNENTNDNNSGNNKNIRSGSTGSRFLSSLTETLRHFNRDWVGMNLLQTRPSERENSERTNHCRGSAHENSRDAQHNSLRGGDGSGHSSDFSHHPPQATPSLSHSTPPTDTTTPPTDITTPPMSHFTPPTDSTTPPTDSTTPPTDSTTPPTDSTPPQPSVETEIVYDDSFPAHEGTAHEDLYSVVFRSRADRPCTPPPQARHLRPCMRRSIERRRIHRHYSNRHQHIYANAPQSTHDSPAQHTAPTAPSMSQLLLHAYNHAHSHAHNHAHTHSHAHTYSHAHSHAHNHAHTQSQTGDSQAPSAVIDERLTTDDTVRPPPPNYSQHTSPGQQPSLSQSQTAPHTSCQPSLSQSQTAPHMSCQPSLSQSQTSPHMSCQPSLSQSQTAPHMSCQPSLSQSQTSPHMSCQPSLSHCETHLLPHGGCLFVRHISCHLAMQGSVLNSLISGPLGHLSMIFSSISLESECLQSPRMRLFKENRD
ncbi:flocculation protein FLO11-like, partial [Aplysia californica]|uniref:Flocculation protein FLO11-like n=1 Tax=Aplysia californica TaxID=6500 RepID=A0ABM1AD14_APLCA